MAKSNLQWGDYTVEDTQDEYKLKEAYRLLHQGIRLPIGKLPVLDQFEHLYIESCKNCLYPFIILYYHSLDYKLAVSQEVILKIIELYDSCDTICHHNGGS